MRGGIQPMPGQRPRNRSGDRSAGRAGGAFLRSAAVATGVVGALVAAAVPAAAQDVTSESAVAQADPMLFGLGIAGLFWLCAGLLAFAAGLVLATRRVHGPVLGAEATLTTTTTISNDRAGGTE